MKNNGWSGQDFVETAWKSEVLGKTYMQEGKYINKVNVKGK
jgi:hypothetical protein